MKSLRNACRLSHLWLGLAGGACVCLMSVSGAIVTLRPPLAEWMAPATTAPRGCGRPVDWKQAEQQIAGFAHQPINRIYAFDGDDPRFHIRLRTSTDAIYDHVIYDACAGTVIGSVRLKWMDWLVDLHHNLLAGRTGRDVAGIFGVALLLSALSGAVVWLLGRPDWRTAFRVRRVGGRSARSWHRAVGLGAMAVLCLEAYTGLWLCFPDAMRATLSVVAQVPKEARAPRPRAGETSGSPVSLAAMVTRAQQAMPDGRVREIRVPDGYGNLQVRFWRPGDFRSLGNNVVTISNIDGRVIAVDLYATKTAPQRFIQAMAGLHYGEWGGLVFRGIYVLAGTATLVLMLTGVALWWGPRTTTARRLRKAA